MKDKRDKEDEQDMQDKQDVISFLCVRHAKSHLSDKGWLWHAKWDDTDTTTTTTILPGIVVNGILFYMSHTQYVDLSWE